MGRVCAGYARVIDGRGGWGVGSVRRMSPEHVRDITFSLALKSRNAYDEAEVDAYLDRIEATLRGEDSLTAGDIRDVEFSHPGIGRRGYAKDEVDKFLDEVAATLQTR